MRPSKGAAVVYQFRDASGSGFGSSIFKNEKVNFKHGQWTDTYSSESSNYRELANLVLSIKEAHARGFLKKLNYLS